MSERDVLRDREKVLLRDSTGVARETERIGTLNCTIYNGRKVSL
jgi:hypothetical protein